MPPSLDQFTVMNKRFLCLLLGLLCWGRGFSQISSSNAAQADSLHSLVTSLYNQENMRGIYGLSDSAFKQFISQDHFADWLQQVHAELGTIEESDYTGTSGGFYNYRTNFQQGSRNLLLAFDSEGKISGFAIRSLFKQKAVKTDNPLSGYIDSVVDQAVRPYIRQENTFGISVGVIVHGREYRYNYGEATNNHQLPGANTLYEIGSITKTFTATLLVDFVLQKKCHLDDPVNDYLPSSIPRLEKAGKAVTLKMLANHTSGLPRIPLDLFVANPSPDDPYQGYDTTRLYRYLDTVRLRTVPGQQFSYSNLGVGLLAVVLSRLSGQSLQALLTQYICGPLKMKDTRLVLNQEQHLRFAEGHDGKGHPIPHWHFKALAGCGAIRSSVDDMLKYLEAHLQPDTTRMLGQAIRMTEIPTYSADDVQIGLGWFHLKDLPAAYWHNGGTGGFRSYCVYDEKKQTAVVVLSNSVMGVDEVGENLIRELRISR